MRCRKPRDSMRFHLLIPFHFINFNFFSFYFYFLNFISISIYFKGCDAFCCPEAGHPCSLKHS